MQFSNDEMKVYFVGAGPGDTELITVKGARLLAEADLVIFTGSLINPKLLEDLDCELIDSNEINLEEITGIMQKALLEGKKVVRLHSGDPSLYGAILEQMKVLEEKGVDVEVVPGVSSIFAVSAALKTQLTLKDVSESLIITRPAGTTLDRDDIASLSRHGATLAIFLGADKIREVVKSLEVPADTPAAVVYRASWPDQKIVQGTVKDIAEKANEAGIKRSAIILVGNVIQRSGFGRSHLYRSR